MRGPQGWLIFSNSILIGILVVFLLAIISEHCGPDSGFCTHSLIYHWQTLIAGLLAIGAALISVWQLQRHRSHTRSQTASAYRASLPLVISNIAGHLERDAEKLRACLQERPPEERYTKPPFDWPADESSGLEVIRALIEFDDDHPEQRNQLSQLLARIQIYRARRRPEKDNMIVTRLNIQSLATDCIDLYALIESLFPYGRPEQLDHPAVSFEDAANAAFVLNFADNEPNGVYERLVRIHGEPNQGWD